MRHIRKITNIALIYTLIGVVLCSKATFILANPSNLRPALQFGNLKDRPGINLRKDEKGVFEDSLKPEFRYYIRDENGRLLKEPCGFPGYWTVELNIPGNNNANAAVERAVKSFSLSAQLNRRGDIQTAKFTIVKILPSEDTDILVKKEGFYIKKSDVFGLEAVLASSFLGRGISEQRELLASAFREIPQGIDLKPQDYATGKRMAMRKLERVLVFNNPLMQKDSTRGFSSLNSSSLALASLLKEAGYGVNIDRHSFINAFTRRPGFKNKLKKHLARLYAKMITKLIMRDIDVVCLSVYDQDLPSVKLFTKLLRKAKPDIIIAVGGHGVTVIPEQVAAHLPEVNIFYRGEAEAGFVRTLESLDNLDLDNIDPQSMGHYFREDRGTMIRLGNIYQFSDFMHVNRMTEEQFNDRELDFSILSARDIDGLFVLMTGLGCPFNCVFCAAAGGSAHRALDPRVVIATARRYQYRLEELEKSDKASMVQKPRHIWRIGLSDDNYLRDLKRAMETLELWKDPGIRVKCAGFQSTLQSFLIKDKTGRWTVNTALMDTIAVFKNLFPHDFRIDIGTDDLLDEEIKRLGKAPYTEKLIEQVLEEFHNRAISNSHYLILVNPETSLENLVEKLLKAAALEAKYNYTDFAINIGITPHIATRLINKIVEEGKESLVRGEVVSISGFEEYDSYWGANKLFSENMPEDMNRYIQNYRRRENNTGLEFLLDFLDYVLEKIDRNLDSIDKEEVRYYEGLLNEGVKQKIREFAEAKEPPLVQNKAYFDVILRYLSSIERKLLSLTKPDQTLTSGQTVKGTQGEDRIKAEEAKAAPHQKLSEQLSPIAPQTDL